MSIRTELTPVPTNHRGEGVNSCQVMDFMTLLSNKSCAMAATSIAKLHTLLLLLAMLFPLDALTCHAA
jgi:hypothetical protein